MRLATCLAVFCLATCGLALADERGVVVQYPFGLTGAFVVDASGHALVGQLPLGGYSKTDCAIVPDGSLGFVPDGAHGLWVLYLASTPPQLADGPNPIAITPRGQSVAVTPDGRFAVVCGDFPTNTLSVVDLDYRVESGTFDLGGECNGIDVCRDGSVLVSSNAGRVRRLEIDAAGNLSDTGEGFPIASAASVRCSPDGRSGVTFDNWYKKLISFRTIGMTPVSERGLPGWGAAAAIAPNGRTVYVRTNTGQLESYDYDPATAALGAAPAYARDLGEGGPKGLAIDPTGSELFVPGYFFLNILHATTLADDDSLIIEDMLYPAGICFRPPPDPACTLGDACDDGNPCTDDACSVVTGTCQHAVNDSNPCSDGNACTIGDACFGGLCVPHHAVDCGAGSACTVGVCDPATGACHDAPRNCDDGNPCTDDACDPGSGCVNEPSPYFTYCDDGDICSGHEYCDGYGSCISSYPLQCDDFAVCTIDGCDPVMGCTNFPAPVGTSCDPDSNPCNGTATCAEDLSCNSGPAPDCDDRNPCTSDTCDPIYGCRHTPAPAYTSCDDGNICNGSDYCDGYGVCISTGAPCYPDGNPCTIEFCDPVYGCGEKPAPAGYPCDDGNACNGAETCDGGGTCVPGSPLDCTITSPCATGSCDRQFGCMIDPYPAGTPCPDGNLCNGDETCSGRGVCVAGVPVVCGPGDSCHEAGVCNPVTGTCSHPPKPDGTVCSDNDLCTTGETCQGGLCTPASSGLNEPNPRTNGYYKRLCHGPHSGDELTDADAVCVASVASTFSGISTVADICAEIEPSQPNGDACDRSDDDLMVLALNICRARVCTAQSIDSQCGQNGTVGQSLAESNAILASASRDTASCSHAKCLDEEINTGGALEMNSLLLSREGLSIRLDWSPPYLNDGSGRPSKYHVWRRIQDSIAPFVQIGTAVDATFLDATAGTGAYQYEVTAVMN